MKVVHAGVGVPNQQLLAGSRYDNCRGAVGGGLDPEAVLICLMFNFEQERFEGGIALLGVRLGLQSPRHCSFDFVEVFV